MQRLPAAAAAQPVSKFTIRLNTDDVAPFSDLAQRALEREPDPTVSHEHCRNVPLIILPDEPAQSSSSSDDATRWRNDGVGDNTNAPDKQRY